MKLQEVIEIMSSPDLLMVLDAESKEELYTGYLANFQHNQDKEILQKRDVTRFRLVIDTKHKRYLEKGLMPPIHTEFIPQYEGKDLQMTIYRCIELGPCRKVGENE